MAPNGRDMTMSIIVIFRASDPEKIKAALEVEFPGNFWILAGTNGSFHLRNRARGL
jgi:hypothetical protein